MFSVGLGIFPESSVVNLAKYSSQQSSRQDSIFKFSHRHADWIFGFEIRFWRGFVVSNRQPLFVFCDDGAVPGTSGDQSQWGEGEVRAVVWAKYADLDD